MISLPLYRYEWNRVASKLKEEGLNPDQIEEQRKFFHKNLKLPASSKDFTHADLTAFKAGVEAWLNPDDFEAQLRAVNRETAERHPNAKRLWVVRDQLRKIGQDVPYAAAVAARVSRGQFSALSAKLEDWPAEALQAAITGLARTVRFAAKQAH